MSSLFSRFNRAKEQFRWLNYQICSDIEELCNGVIIELVDWPDFLNWFNLRFTQDEISPKDKRKREFLIHTLADFIDANKDIARYGDATIYPKWEKLDEEERLLKLLSLDKADRAKVIKETWEKKVVEKCTISYKEHKKHRAEAKQCDFYDNYRSQSKKNSEFVKNIHEILRNYKKFKVSET
jgi:hypothetical protein